MHAERRISSLTYRVDAGQAFIWAPWVPAAGMAAVQHGSTAPHTDRGGRAGTQEDGDLHRETRVDVLPPDGMQEVSGSSPLSSTGQKRNSKHSNRQYSRKVQQRRPGGPPYLCSDRGIFLRRSCWQDSGFQTLNRRWPACHLRKSPCHRSRGSCRRVTTGSPGGLFLPATVVAFASSPAALAVLVVRVYSQGAAPAGEGREFADGTL